MEKKSWEILESEGWVKRKHPVTGRTSYRHPGPKGRVVNSKRDLTESERAEIGDLLFPGRMGMPGSTNSVSEIPVASTSNMSASQSISVCDSRTSEVMPSIMLINTNYVICIGQS